MSKSRKIIIIISGIAITLAFIIGLVIFMSPKTFPLSSEYYNSDGEFQTASIEDLEKLIAEHKSFAVFVYQPACRTSEDFERLLTTFSAEHDITFLKTPFAQLKSSGLVPDLKYYPSMLLYQNGELVTFLRADSDEDLKVYQDINEFTAWWNRYIGKW